MSTKILCIETSTEVCGVCLSVDGHIIIDKELVGFKHSSHLVPLMMEVLEEAGVSRTELSAIAISKGPGSYTGLRVGASTAKGWAFGLDVPLIAIDTLQSLAQGVGQVHEDDVIIPMMDARRNEVYTAIYNSTLERLTDIQPQIVDESFEEFLPNKGNVILCGNGAFKADKYQSDRIEIRPSECAARNIASLSVSSYNNGLFEDLSHFEPFYLKPPNIGKPKPSILG